MDKIIPNIELSLLATDNKQRCLVFVFPDDNSSNDFYNSLVGYSLLWYYDSENKLTIRITLSDIPYILTIKLLKELSTYKNIDWLLDHKLDVISVGFYDSLGTLVYNHPLSLNYQSPE